MRTLLEFAYRFYHEEEAPTFLEYGLLIALIATVAAVGIAVFGDDVRILFENGRNAFP